jgi:hypothetical protein
MDNPRIQVFPTLDLLSRPEIEKAARDALFGPRMAVYSGGWSYHDRDTLKKLPISPVTVTTADAAEEVAMQFMQAAQERWERAGQTTKLFPLDRAMFRLARAETRQVWAKRRPLAWMLTWIVLADTGAAATQPRGQRGRFAPIDMAEIKLAISLAGRVVGGSATWRPTGRAINADQHVDPDAVLETITSQRARASGGDGHGHATPSPTAPAPEPVPQPFFELRYSAGARQMVTNFIDPRLHYIEPNHPHGPGLVIPVTDYGLSAQLLTTGSRAEDGDRGEITVAPWVTGCRGTVPMVPLPGGYRAHWAVVDLTENSEEETPVFRDGGAPLKLSGLAHVSFTVMNEMGCIAHAYEDVCGALDPREPVGPESATERPVA